MIHVAKWNAAATMTDMSNAGKRGKTCRTMTVTGWCNGGMDDYCRHIHDTTIQVTSYLAEVNTAADFDEVRAAVVKMVADAEKAGHLGEQVKVYDREIRGVDAPKPVLTHRNEKWFITLDGDGIHMGDLTDQHNEPRQITPSSQSKNKAYALACKVWDAVVKCETMGEASRVLSAAGCALHYYCAMD